jgi:hypothetical protein
MAFSKLPGTPFTWNVQMVLPLDSTGANGMPLLSGGTGKFLFWYDASFYSPGMTHTDHTFPREQVGQTTYNWTTASAVPPDPASVGWAEIDLQTPSTTCQSGGLDITSDQIGTAQTPPVPTSYIDPAIGASNVFFATPTYYNGTGATTVTAGQIKARFRIADWGSVADPDAPWDDITNLGAVPNSADIAPGTTAAINNITGTWSLTKSEHCEFVGNNGQYDPYVGASVPPDPTNCPTTWTKTLHQCMQVTLSAASANIDFIRNSVSRNMDFAHASTFRQNAQINIKGIPSLGGTARDAYVFVEKLNMPAFPTLSSGTGGPPSQGGGGSSSSSSSSSSSQSSSSSSSSDGGINEVRARAVQTTLPPPATAGLFTQTAAKMPTVIYHVYHDTGQKQTLNGATYSQLEAQDSFGYFVSHDGLLFGWETALAGATEIAPNFYKLSVPEGGRTNITTSVGVVDLTTWWIWVLLLLILLIIAFLVWLIRKVFH